MDKRFFLKSNKWGKIRRWLSRAWSLSLSLRFLDLLTHFLFSFYSFSFSFASLFSPRVCLNRPLFNYVGRNPSERQIDLAERKKERRIKTNKTNFFWKKKTITWANIKIEQTNKTCVKKTKKINNPRICIRNKKVTGNYISNSFIPSEIGSCLCIFSFASVRVDKFHARNLQYKVRYQINYNNVYNLHGKKPWHSIASSIFLRQRFDRLKWNKMLPEKRVAAAVVPK